MKLSLPPAVVGAACLVLVLRVARAALSAEPAEHFL
jgi:hypothetical protein